MIKISDNTEYSAAMYRKLSAIAAEARPESERLQAVFEVFRKITDDLAAEQKIALFTQFARISYVCFRFEVSADLQRYIYEYRRLAYDTMFQRIPFKTIYLDLSLYATAHFIAAVFNDPIPDDVLAHLPEADFYTFNAIVTQSHFRTLRVVALEDKPLENVFICHTDAFETQIPLRVHYKVSGRNDAMEDTISAIRRHLRQSKAVTLMLHQADVTAEMAVYARLFVVEPDYLLEVTAISECVQSDNKKPLIWLHLLKKFIATPTTPAIMLGHISNYFLDTLIHHRKNIEAVEYDVFFKKAFRLNPLAFSLYSDTQIKEMYNKGKIHFDNIKRMVSEGFEKEGIDLENCYLEPTFYSAEYGIYGRLDVFHQSPKGISSSAIVELKSGKSFRPNGYGINNNNYTQTLLYDLLLKSVYQTDEEIGKYVLYSGAIDGQNLKYAGVTPQIQADAVQIRNQLTNIDWLMCDLTDKSALRGDTILDSLAQKTPPPGFIADDHKAFLSTFGTLRNIERMYFIAFTGFIAREHRLARIGTENEQRNGMAGLWRTPLEEKINNFSIFYKIKIEHFEQIKDNYFVRLAIAHDTPPTNFRIGDIGVLYAIQDERSLPLHTQIFKCSVLLLAQNSVTVKLRSAQINPTDFSKPDQFWSLEQDTMDSGFVQQYKNVFQLMEAAPLKRALLFGESPPATPTNAIIPTYKGLTDEQAELLTKALQSRDYFLLWGPPGSGKTSQMLRYYVQYLMENTNEKVLLLAFTNRAVEEICEAIASIGTIKGQPINDIYLRIGNRIGSNPHFAAQFFEDKIANCDRRSQLKNVIEKHRLIVSTVSGAMGKTELFELGTKGDLQGFDRVVIDEASQLTEPMLVGLLPRFKHFMLIGDHRQLPAVVAQSEDESAVRLPKSDTAVSLHDIGLYNLRNSLFERLYLLAQAKNWTWAYAQLSKQGRMHTDINGFPSQYFYDGNLQPFLPKQFAPNNAAAPYKRLDFINTPPDNTAYSNKTNTHEALRIKDLVLAFYKLYEADFNENTIGIITPYRAQIAAIRSVLAADTALTHILPLITIDTVERYQGSARSVILISLCTNSVQQLNMMVSTHHENGKNIDRKLNVALTRAREYLILIGNKTILAHDPTYAALLRWIDVNV